MVFLSLHYIRNLYVSTLSWNTSNLLIINFIYIIYRIKRHIQLIIVYTIVWYRVTGEHVLFWSTNTHVNHYDICTINDVPLHATHTKIPSKLMIIVIFFNNRFSSMISVTKSFRRNFLITNTTIRKVWKTSESPYQHPSDTLTQSFTIFHTYTHIFTHLFFHRSVWCSHKSQNVSPCPFFRPPDRHSRSCYMLSRCRIKL